MPEYTPSLQNSFKTRSVQEVFQDRTCYSFLNKPVDKHLLVAIYDLMKLGPTSANTCPLRIVFVESKKEKEKLCQHVMVANVDKIKSAPITAIFAYDTKFYEQLDVLFPHNPGMKDFFSSSTEIALDTAVRNSSLQAAYFMIIARSYDLSCGPMSGFDANGINQMFFQDSNYKVNFLCNLGYRDNKEEHPRLARLDFSKCCIIV